MFCRLTFILEMDYPILVVVLYSDTYTIVAGYGQIISKGPI